jgi:cysteine sulfinate desulfinase/cysteine desulfurase-like protein
MHELLQMRLANPSSQHSAGRKARHIVEQARESILKHCGGRTRGMASDHLLFTSGGTESNNLAIFGLAENIPGAIVVSAIEHPSVLGAAEFAKMKPAILKRCADASIHDGKFETTRVFSMVGKYDFCGLCKQIEDLSI